MTHDSQAIDDDDEQSSDLNPLEDAVDLSLSEEMPDWGGGELEAAYLKAMSALEASEVSLPAEPLVPPDHQEDSTDDVSDHSQSAASVSANSFESADAGPLTATEASNVALEPVSNRESSVPATMNATKPSPSELPPTPLQIIEAFLFVGGTPLTASRLASVLRGDFESEFVDRSIDDLNRLYAAENRPYEIRLGEGGYRLALREEFERIRHKVYGLGPKEVRLSQDALEVLAVVAYHQPIKQSRVEELGKPGCGAVLKQLVRRELLAIERDPAHPRDVSYKTTPRFLSLFGIQNLDELPRHEQVTYK